MRTFFIDVRNIKYIILSDTYFCRNSIKIENQTVSKVSTKEESLNSFTQCVLSVSCDYDKRCVSPNKPVKNKKISAE